MLLLFGTPRMENCFWYVFCFSNTNWRFGAGYFSIIFCWHHVVHRSDYGSYLWLDLVYFTTPSPKIPKVYSFSRGKDCDFQISSWLLNKSFCFLLPLFLFIYLVYNGNAFFLDFYINQML